MENRAGAERGLRRTAVMDAGIRVTAKERQIDAAPITPEEEDANISLCKLDVYVYRSR